MITALYFPREVLPVSSVLAQTFDTAIGVAAVALLLPFMGLNISAALLWVPVLALLLLARASRSSWSRTSWSA